MAYKLTVNDKTNGISFACRYENMAKAEKPAIVAKAPSGAEVHERSTYQGNVLTPGSTQRQWVDDTGTVYSKQELTFWFGDQQVNEINQTKLFDIQGYQPEKNYTDNYVISTYYELSPGDNDMKKDFDKDVARRSNLYQMRKLWEYLDTNKVVARGEFNTSSKGFVAGDGYMRAVKFGNKWGIEIGVFKEEKVFEHLNEGIPQETALPVKTAGLKLKRV